MYDHDMMDQRLHWDGFSSVNFGLVKSHVQIIEEVW